MNTGHKYGVLGSETKSNVLVKAIVAARVKSFAQFVVPTGQCNKGRVTSLPSLDGILGEEPQVSETPSFYKEADSKTVQLLP